ncbi:hypothetical protein H9X90_10610 [Faecalicatena contorta]|uniref:hypothetical protein n=1 Tax=Faecalicatena contorta TaxID=39482 RepID=UPI00195FD62B|nr:hypothetical protein [Faecalicatena contorta]MBM6685599.1 hypothetical protein [Faecalicatena contorta]MBM6711186.1 hypothetical protein [Faecalicatena contorta]
MDIVVSTPGSPGTTFTDNVKNQIVVIYDVVNSTDDFDNVSGLRTYLEVHYGFKQTYTRNILAFLQNCGIVTYQNVDGFQNKKFFTNIGCAYVDILKCLQIANEEPESPERDAVIRDLKNIEEIIYFQCLKLMMMKTDCNYAEDFFDVLRFTDRYQHIDSTEYLLIQYEREQNHRDFLSKMQQRLFQYRDRLISINVKTKTKNDSNGKTKSVNSFPYVQGNFTKAGVFVKNKDNQFFINEKRRTEVDSAIKEIEARWQTLAM